MDLRMDQNSMPHLMHKAIIDGNLGKVKSLLNFGCSPDIILVDHTHLTPLICATLKSKLLVVRLLLTVGADVDIKDKWEMTPLMHACVHNKPDILPCLLQAGADVRAVDGDGKTALLHAAHAGSVECFQSLISHPDVNLNDTDVEGRSVVALAARRDDSRCLQYLLTLPVDVNKVDKNGDSPLLASIHLCSLNNALILLDHHKVEVNVMNKEGKTPLTKAFEQVRNDCIMPVLKKLFLCGAKPNFSSLDEYFIHEMIARGEQDIVQMMIINGCGPRLRHCKESIFKFRIDDEISPFAVALLSNQLGIAKYLLANLFLTKFDMHKLCTMQGVMHHLIERKFLHCKSLLTDFSSNPFPLVTLSFVAASGRCCDDGWHTWSDINRDKLPNKVSRKLFFQTEYAYLCQHEWKTIPLLMLKSAHKVPNARNLSVFWPVGHEVQECQFPTCLKRKGFKIVRENIENLSGFQNIEL